MNSLLGDGTIYDWRIVYLLHAAILLVTNAIFCFLATAKPASWTGEEPLPSRIRSMNNKIDTKIGTLGKMDEINTSITSKSPISNHQNMFN